MDTVLGKRCPDTSSSRICSLSLNQGQSPNSHMTGRRQTCGQARKNAIDKKEAGEGRGGGYCEKLSQRHKRGEEARDPGVPRVSDE